MNDILDNLFYKEKLGIGNKTTFIKKVRERHPEIKVKDIQDYIKNQEVSQINTTVNKTYQYKITAPPRTFQIDIFWWKRGETLIPILLLVDVLSRKAWAYVLTKSKQEKRAEVSVKTLEEFKNEVGQINGLTGDNEFSSAAIRKFCDDNNIRLDTSVAKEEHISNGNKLGIIDRLVRTLRELIEKYYDITGYRTDNIKDVMKSIIDTYNNNSHRTLKNKTPNEVFKDNDDQTARHLNDTMHNQAIYKSVPFNDGDKVRILEKKEKFDKGKKKFSKELYTINKKEGYKILVNGTSRKLKPAELLKASTTANPISEKYIQDKKEEKKAGKVINSLVRNAKMTPAEAKTAVATVNEPGGRGQREKKKVVKMDL
jgi:hypothetical protein